MPEWFCRPQKDFRVCLRNTGMFRTGKESTGFTLLRMLAAGGYRIPHEGGFRVTE
jgi:hypothetical protein